MGIIAKDSTSHPRVFIPCPSGVMSAVLVDVVDLGTVEKRWRDQPARFVRQVRLVWEVDELMMDERPFIVGRRFTLSLHKKSSLRSFLEAWRTKPFTDDDLRDGFDMEGLVGVPCLLSVIHESGYALDGTPTTYARVVSAARLPAGMAAHRPAGHYVRMRDRSARPLQQAG
jgi:hypothetical protein